MKKIFLSLSGLIVLALVIIFTVDAQKSDKQDKKANAIVSQEILTSTTVVKCCGNSDSKIASCNVANCSKMKCDPTTCKDGKCDPATCKEGICDPATCKPNCDGVSAEMKCGPMDCNR